jgi:hypothetical protein
VLRHMMTVGHQQHHSMTAPRYFVSSSTMPTSTRGSSNSSRETRPLPSTVPHAYDGRQTRRPARPRDLSRPHPQVHDVGAAPRSMSSTSL